MSLLTVNLDDIRIIDCGKYGAFKGVPKYKPFLLQQDSFLLGNHELCLTSKELSGGSMSTTKRLGEGMEKFIKEFLGPYLDPLSREGIVEQTKRDADDKSQNFVSLVREEFDEVKFSNIIELKFQRIPFWSGRKMIYITFKEGGSISFLVCGITI